MALLLRRTQVLLVAAFVLPAPGCLTPPKPQPETARKPASAKHVKTGGACLDLGEGHQAAYKTDEFVAKAAELLSANRQASARHFVSLYPDLCQEALRRTTNAEASTPAITLIARIHDEQTGLAGTPLSWSALLKERVRDPQRFAAYDAARKRTNELLQRGQLAEGIATGITKLASHPMLEFDAHRLVGEGLLHAEQPDRAIAEFSAALSTVSASPYQSAQLQLLLGEAYRQAGQIELGVGAWQQAVVTASRTAVENKSLTDPILWETASALRPVNSAWPDTVVAAMVPANATRRAAGADEAYLWKRVGQWRLDRGEPQAALLAFKRAESMAAEPSLQEDLHLLQATALSQLGQGAAAAALLTPLVDKQRPAISAAALATLGALKLQSRAAPQAAILLKKAFEIGQSAEWPGRAEAEADFGLACLLTNESAAGIEKLHSAELRFETSGNMLMLRQCLENEAAYYQRAGIGDEANRVRSKLDSIENCGK